jgi:hypothetical protein
VGAPGKSVPRLPRSIGPLSAVPRLSPCLKKKRWRFTIRGNRQTDRAARRGRCEGGCNSRRRDSLRFPGLSRLLAPPLEGWGLPDVHRMRMGHRRGHRPVLARCLDRRGDCPPRSKTLAPAWPSTPKKDHRSVQMDHRRLHLLPKRHLRLKKPKLRWSKLYLR